MERPDDIFHVCRRYAPDRAVVPPDPESPADCVSCSRNYDNQVCPVFRSRLVRMLGFPSGGSEEVESNILDMPETPGARHTEGTRE